MITPPDPARFHLPAFNRPPHFDSRLRLPSQLCICTCSSRLDFGETASMDYNCIVPCRVRVRSRRNGRRSASMLEGSFAFFFRFRG